MFSLHFITFFLTFSLSSCSTLLACVRTALIRTERGGASASASASAPHFFRLFRMRKRKVALAVVVTVAVTITIAVTAA
jgi:hypothetical protein